MATRRFKVDDCTGPFVRIAGGQARHALRVLRLNVGAEVVLFDGSGREAAGRIHSTAERHLDVQVTIVQRIDSRQAPILVIAVATPRGPRADWLVEKCAELGTHSLWPLSVQRSVVTPSTVKLERWRRKAVEVAKQAGQAVPMTIEPPRSLAEVLAAAQGMRVFYGDHLGGRRPLMDALRVDPQQGGPVVPVLVVVGPEGGLTEQEQAAIKGAGGEAVRLGSSILRTETAAVAAVAVWASAVIHVGGDMHDIATPCRDSQQVRADDA